MTGLATEYQCCQERKAFIARIAELEAESGELAARVAALKAERDVLARDLLRERIHMEALLVCTYGEVMQ